MQDCENCGCKIKVERNQYDIQILWGEINGMKKMFIAGMAGLLLNGIVFIGSFVLALMGKVQIHF